MKLSFFAAPHLTFFFFATALSLRAAPKWEEMDYGRFDFAT
jgi:hypothetical protein